MVYGGRAKATSRHNATTKRLRAPMSNGEAFDVTGVMAKNAFKPFGCSTSLQRDVNLDDEFTCITCGRRLSSHRRLLEHTRIHEPYFARPYACGSCQKRFTSSSDLAKHTKTSCPSNDDRCDTDFTCLTCGKGLSSRRRLLEHLRIHESYACRTHVCGNCQMRFVTACNRTSHQISCRLWRRQ